MRAIEGGVTMQAINLPIDSIRISDDRARKTVLPESLEGLARSVEETGLLHPIIVKQIEQSADDNKDHCTTHSPHYELVAGLRRLKAVAMAGQTTIAALVLTNDVDPLQVQLVENLQREDLNPVERALAVHEFMKVQGLTNKSEAARRLGVPRSTLTDWLDLLEVSPRFQEAVIDNFYGGDSPLTPSHVSEALALARKLDSPHLHEVLLDAVLQHKLSKSETRRVAQIVRENRNISIKEAIYAVRGTYAHDDRSEERIEVTREELLPHEENLAHLVRNLSRSTRYIERLNHLSSRFVDEAQVARLIEHYSEIAELAERGLARLRLEDPELLETIERQRRQRKMHERRRNRRIS